jgi:hypothetical protein
LEERNLTESQPGPGNKVGFFHAKQSLMAAFGVMNINSTSLRPATNHRQEQSYGRVKIINQQKSQYPANHQEEKRNGR